jgi:hypothetical protein
MIVIADIAGQFDALLRLVEKCPKEEIVLVGDLVDRGHESFEVIEWAMKTPNVRTLLGNHEHMMLDFYSPLFPGGLYGDRIWKGNGGSATIASYARHGFKRPPDAHLEWLKNLPTYFKPADEKILVTHAALAPRFEIETIPAALDVIDQDFDHSVLWNRGEPVPRPYFQVFGHNSHWGLRPFSDSSGGAWALCIDQSQKGILTAFHWPTGELIEEPYLRGQREVEA